MPAAGSDRLDRRSTVPLYAQIRDGLQEQIDSHTLPPGTPLPTEEELQRLYGVSRSVVRQALGDLAQRGVVRRRRGSGSVVAPRREHRRRATEAGGLDQQVAEAGGRLRTEVLALVAEPAPARAAAALGTEQTWRLDRVRSDGDPIVVVRHWIPRSLFPALSSASLAGGSLHAWMREHGHRPAGGRRHLQAVPADAAVAECLGIERGLPVLLLEGVTSDAEGRGLEWFSAWHHPRTVFDVDAEVDPRVDAGPAAETTPHAELRRARALLDEARELLGP